MIDKYVFIIYNNHEMRTLKQIRMEKNIQQKAIVCQLNIKQNTYSQYENGIRQPAIEQLPKLAKILNCSIDEIVMSLIAAKQQYATKNSSLNSD